MKLASIAFLFSALAAVGGSVAADKGPHWAYSGNAGPSNWHLLGEEYAACAGSEQSPINLTRPISADVEDVQVSWQTFRPEVVNNGHTIQANAPQGSCTTFGGIRYEFRQVHWHHTSEHAIAGELAPLEAHFVHENEDSGELLVLGVMMVRGEANAELEKIWAVAPQSAGSARTDSEVSLAALLPSGGDRYRYAGSLTTPPCSEIVSWVVYDQPVTVSESQIARFKALYPSNNRPLQAQGRRFLLRGQ